MTNAQNANYESPEAKSLLSQATNEYNLAVSLASQGKWQDAVSHLNTASNFLAQAPAKEQAYQEQKWQQQLILIGGISAIAIVAIIVIMMRRKEKVTTTQA